MIIEIKLRSPSVCLPVEFVSFSALRGENGVGVPKGGKKGQVLKKSGDGDFETEWSDDIQGQGGTIVSVGGKPVANFNADTKLDDKSIPHGGFIKRNDDGTFLVVSAEEFSEQLNSIVDNRIGNLDTALDEILALQAYYTGETFDALHEYAEGVIAGGES